MMRIRVNALLAGCLVCILGLPLFSQTSLSLTPQDNRVTIERGVAASMRDGVKLMANVYRPKGEGRFPVILIRTPYGKDRFEKTSSFVRHAVEKGYGVIVQDVRGCSSSEGELNPYAQEINDGYDAVEWAASLPYSSGKIGTEGCSYLGAVQWQLATAAPPHLAAIFPQCTFANSRHFFYFGGAFIIGWISWLNERLPDIQKRRGMKVPTAEEAQREWSRNMWKWLGYLPLKDLPLLKGFFPCYYDWLAHPDDGPFWDFANVEKKHKDVTVPAYNMTGWFDDGYGQPGAITNFLGMRKNGKTKSSREGQKLIIGPWTHLDIYYGRLGSRVGDVDFGPEAEMDLDALVIRWCDHWLKGIDNGLENEPPIKIFVMGDNKWRSEQEWPLARTEFTPFYLHGQGEANSLNGNGSLSRQNPQAEKPDHYIYDPANPIIDRSLESGPRDQRAVEVRNDVLVYTSAPLTKELEATGPIEAEIWASSSAKDTDFVVRLTDVYPDGYSQNITPPLSGILRARYRESEFEQKLLVPGQVYKFEVNLMYTSHVFKIGHRIRVSITSSAFPDIDRNPNTGAPFGEDARLIPAAQTIYHDEQHPSLVRLPVIPR
jgi:putative CocE/NonD family hydrolase